MTNYLSELLNVFIPYIACIPIFLYPMWKTRNARTRSVIIYLCCHAVFASLILLFVRQHRDIDTRTIQAIMLSVTLPANIMPFFVFRRRIMQNIFLQAVRRAPAFGRFWASLCKQSTSCMVYPYGAARGLVTSLAHTGFARCWRSPSIHRGRHCRRNRSNY